MDNIRILLADDHTVLRQGMAQALNQQPDMTVIAQAGDGREVESLARELRPDLILMDIHMPGVDGLEATRTIKADLPGTAVLILSMFRQEDYVLQAIQAGADGYLLKEVELDDLLTAIRRVAAGESVIDSSLAGQIFAALRRPPAAEAEKESDLSPRDIELLGLLALGLTNQEIADRLDIAEKTVRNRLSDLFHRLHFENRTQAALFALRQGIDPPDSDPTA